MTVPLTWLDDHLGPVEIVAFTLPASNTAPAWQTLLAAVERGAVRLLDLEFLRRTEPDAAEVLAADDLPDDIPAEFIGSSAGLLTDADILDLLEEVPVGQTLAVLLVEHLGLLGVLHSFETAGAQLVTDGAVSLSDLEAAVDATDDEEN